MALHHDLLRQARMLAYHEPKKPKQASLRRAVSTAYYALFHLLTSEAWERFMSGADRSTLRGVFRRAFDHNIMKDACSEIKKPNAGKLRKSMDGAAVPASLYNVAAAFVQLQEARHFADYDVTMTFARSDVRDLIDLVERAFIDWQTVRKTVPADVFLTALLANRGICR